MQIFFFNFCFVSFSRRWIRNSGSKYCNINFWISFYFKQNKTFQQINKFGNPYKRGKVDSVTTELYKLNTDTSKNDVTNSFSAIANGTSESFEVVNGTFLDEGYFYEEAPDPNAATGMYYRNDIGRKGLNHSINSSGGNG